jgi:hypothetical protein
MRSPVVKRQTTPERGFYAFSPAFCPLAHCHVATGPASVALWRSERERASVSNHPGGAGSVPSTLIGVQRRTCAYIVARGGSGASQGCPVRRQAHLRLSLSHPRMGACHTPSAAFTRERPPELMSGPRRSRPGLDHVFSPRWRSIAALPDAPGGRRRPLPSRPTGEAHCRCWSLRCPSAFQRIPWRP